MLSGVIRLKTGEENKMKTIIKNGRVITPDWIIDGYVLYEDGKIAEIQLLLKRLFLAKGIF